MNKLTLDEARRALEIDPDDLYTCLVEQPEWYYHVAEQNEYAEADRDAIKLSLDEAMAELDNQYRLQAVETKEKLTEPMLENKIQVAPKVKELNRDYLGAKKRAGLWAAMKHAFDKRASSINKIVDKEGQELYALGLERGAANTKSRLAENMRQRREQDL